jgi:predicted O-linked N-acetylglucosamine transferase (SPINDLY family)
VDESFQGPLLPFDTLLVSMSLESRLIVGKAFSSNFPSDAGSIVQKFIDKKVGYQLRIGFISYDFNDHPTAHLIEGIFKIIQEKRSLREKNVSEGNIFDSIYTVIFSYGKDDGSVYRSILQRTPDEYVDIAAESHLASIAAIQYRNIDILLDMQLFTLGHRAEIIAARPAPIQVNYLVYPGSSGAHFLDFIVVDRKVVPAEHAKFYSEKLLFLPPSYQVSYYDGYPELSHSVEPPLHIDFSYKQRLRSELGLPTDSSAIILCNFNKLDKLEPESFSIWMQIMSRVRHSHLWLLLPSKETEKNDIAVKNLLSISQLFGIEKHRIIFAPRISKAVHIRRHLAADLFVDTIVYGAHSTSTDALRGALPVLTMEGGEFPNRVVSSLYASFDSIAPAAGMNLGHLVCNSAKEFEDIAVRLLSDDSGAYFY